METFEELLKEIEGNREQQNQLKEQKKINDEEIDVIYSNYKSNGFREKAKKATTQRYKIEKDIIDKKLKGYILKNNAKIVLFTDVKNDFIDIFSQYASKQNGKVTNEKLRKDIKDKLNCDYISIHTSEIYITKNYIDILIYINQINDNQNLKSCFVDENNKICDIKNFNLYIFYDKYIENIDEHIKYMRETYIKVKDLQNQLDCACEEYNNLALFDEATRIYKDSNLYNELYIK